MVIIKLKLKLKWIVNNQVYGREIMAILGAQVVGMGKATLHNSNAKALFTKAQEILGYDLLDLCLNGTLLE